MSNTKPLSIDFNGSTKLSLKIRPVIKFFPSLIGEKGKLTTNLTSANITNFELLGTCTNLIHDLPIKLVWNVKPEDRPPYEIEETQNIALEVQDKNGPFKEVPYKIKVGQIFVGKSSNLPLTSFELNILKLGTFEKGKIGYTIQIPDNDIYSGLETIIVPPEESGIQYDIPLNLKFWIKRGDTEIALPDIDKARVGDTIIARVKPPEFLKDQDISISYTESELPKYNSTKKESELISISFEPLSDSSREALWTIGAQGGYLTAIDTIPDDDRAIDLNYALYIDNNENDVHVSYFALSNKLLNLQKPQLREFTLAKKENGDFCISGFFDFFANDLDILLHVFLFKGQLNTGTGRMSNITPFDKAFEGYKEGNTEFIIPSSSLKLHATFKTDVAKHQFDECIFKLSSIPEEVGKELGEEHIFAVLRFAKDDEDDFINFADIADYEVNEKNDDSDTGFAPFGESGFASKLMMGTGVCSNCVNLKGETFALEADNSAENVYTVVDNKAWIRDDSFEEIKENGKNVKVSKYTQVLIEKESTEGLKTFAKIKGTDGTDYQWTTKTNLHLFYKNSREYQIAQLAPEKSIDIEDSWNANVKKSIKKYNQIGGLLNMLAKPKNIEVAALLAIWFVESGANDFVKNESIIRFENHLFYKLCPSEKQAEAKKYISYATDWKNHKFDPQGTSSYESFHGNQDLEYDVLEKAIELTDKETAYSSISIGGHQVIIGNYLHLGYTSAEELYDAHQGNERSHILSFFDFCETKLSNPSLFKTSDKLFNYIKNKHFKSFVSYYNGAKVGSDKNNKYSSDMTSVYNKLVDILE